MTRSERVVAFLILPSSYVSGGVMATFSYCRESRRFEHVHGAEVMLCTAPGPETHERNEHFDNDELIRPFQHLVDRMDSLESLVLHIQPWPWEQFYGGLAVYAPLLRAIPHLHINVLNMNVAGMPSPATFASALTLTPNVTQTTAHARYATQAVCDAYGVPLHHLSVWLDPGRYRRAAFADKEPLIAYSDEQHAPAQAAVLDALRSGLPDYELVRVRDMHHADYRELIARARHVISFGEGFDGYFVETVLAGGVPFAVYNDVFFPSGDYADYANVYPDHETMAGSIVGDITAFDDGAGYRALNEELFGRVVEIYDTEAYLSNLERFYRGEYDFTPSPESRAKWLAGVIAEKDALIAGLERTVSHLVDDQP